jgi:peptidoglycan biosynthesis protein MviN/MurJ (putative lipid II flippase)
MLASGAPAAIPAVLGDVWREAADPLPFACLGLVMVGPVSVAAAGYLFAVGDAATVLRGAILHTIATLGVGFALLPFLGVVSLGLGVLASAVVEAVVLGRGTARQAGTRNLATVTVLPTLCAAAAGGAGWVVADRLGPTLPSALLAAGAAGALYVGLLGLIRPRLLRESWAFTSRAARRAF